ncbi:hypothetical protein QA612_08600 [Evansella sp. AB-P1]|uniref:YpoC family protein n=1 Tax=Evansella sp. AB-P1 TaxID=3037653 RepID=UPI00241D3D5E|nr:hypothetical protein [Evansella sp. AB-P1]MDG5787553.1 hypothetical protein [Evansella sp. AB-P1]
MREESIIVPKEFCRQPFYSNGDTIEISDQYFSLESIWNDQYFYHDIHYTVKTSSSQIRKPWVTPNIIGKMALDQWKKEGLPTLQQLFSHRDRKGARPLMIKYLAVYLQMMHWSNGEPIKCLHHIEEQIQSLSFAPLNVTERVSFILTTPDHHHSFTALSQLFNESVKKIAIHHFKK